MPEQPGGEKTLPASPQKKQKAREDGNVAKSQDLNAAWALLVSLGALLIMGPGIFASIIAMGRDFIGHAHELIPARAPVSMLAQRASYWLMVMVLPFALVMVVAGVFLNLIQVGPLLTAKPLAPKLDRINPISGFGRLFSLRSLVELIKSLAKLGIVFYLVYLALQPRVEDLARLLELPPELLTPVIAEIVYAVWWRIALAMFVLGLLDFAYQRWQNEQDLRMTVQEARQEAKELEGDPLIKRRVRQLQRQMAQQRMMQDVPTAEVVITNPTEFAVALRYDAREMDAPVVIAKGQRLNAQRIRDLAAEHNVPIVEKPELARALYRGVEVGGSIPGTLFRAVAEVLSYVYRIDQRAEKQRERAEAAALDTRAAV